MRNIYFTWERQMTGNWTPVCYHGEKPKALSPSDAYRRGTVHKVEDDMIDVDGTPNFAALIRKHPLTASL